MNSKIKAIGIITAIVAGFIILPSIAAQQENDYRAFLIYQYANTPKPDGNNITILTQVTYVPVVGSATYTLSYTYISPKIDLSKPTTISDQLATAIKADGAARGYNVVKVFVPSYDQKIP